MSRPVAFENRAGFQILVVEDHADTLKYLTLFLESLGHDVRSTTSPAEALESLECMPVDVLISDVGFSGGDDWELLRKARLPASVSHRHERLRHHA